MIFYITPEYNSFLSYNVLRYVTLLWEKKLLPVLIFYDFFVSFFIKKKRYNQNLRSSNLEFLFYIILIVTIKKSLNNNENRISA